MIRFGHVHRDGAQSRLSAGGAAAGELSRRARPFAEADVGQSQQAAARYDRYVEGRTEGRDGRRHRSAGAGSRALIAARPCCGGAWNDPQDRPRPVDPGCGEGTTSRRCCDLVVAMIVDRLITPRSKLGFVRAVDEETAISSLGAVLHLGRVKEREAYEALDWLLERQARIENGFARRHLEDGGWSSMTSVHHTPRAAAARWRATATAGITARTGRRSSMDCS